ncbi:Transcription factor [Trema orientale]|uniref:Transcription factor n=1 Tax=Trema orientale TaxID=63057 RepID=A0A2P5EL35_TREOI|nr:Transcription factor [Trema orientale]
MSGTGIGRGKRKEEEQELASDDGDGTGHGPPKKTTKTDDSDDVVVCEISKNRRVSVRNWNGRIVVDIREFYLKDGKQLPGKKGISLTMDQWNILRDHVEEIDKAVNENS